MDLFDYEKEHLDFLRKHLAECTVLLKTDGSFPLEKAGNIAAYGNGIRKTIKGGTGSGEVNSRYFVNVEQGLKESGFLITTEKWLDRYEELYKQERKKYIKNLRIEAKNAHVNSVLYCMGKNMPEPDYSIPLDFSADAAVYVVSRVSGEGSDIEPIPGEILLTETEKRDILELNSRYKRFMLVLNTGGPVDLSGVSCVRNILVLSQLGSDTGFVLADILLGKVNPSGKLATTWTSWKDYPDIGDFGNLEDTRYREGIYVGYRYFDSTGKKALFPFGYGISYTAFSINTDIVTLEESVVTVKATIKNTGKMGGKETLEVYLSSPSGKLDKPFQELACFKKTSELMPGCKEQVSASFDICDMASYSEDLSSYVLEKGKYIVRSGNSSVDNTIVAVIELNEDVVVLKVENKLGKTDFCDYKPEKPIETIIPEGIPVLKLESSTILTRTVNYDDFEEVDVNVSKFTDEQVVYANIGGFNPKGGLLSVIGNASQSVAGAAGETTNMLKDCGVPVAVMADGPQGLRLSQRFYRDKKGLHILGQGLLPETFIEFMSPFMKWLMSKLGGKSKPPKNIPEEYQYCTALPIGTALAQSWNTDFIEECGNLVGDEMERFGIHFWLAPAMNIHRDIRCGRNFEYYSEDPILSGLAAAAITRGVQKHEGRAVVIKHFFANNQETNRTGSSSMVSERAAREIYLKGFGICIRNTRPLGVMSSYNLVNGVHTNEHRGLSRDILRCEFGFDGILMTDWLVGSGVMNRKEDKYAPSHPYLVAKAGGNLFMPGSKRDFIDLFKALSDGKIDRRQLEINATQTLRVLGRIIKK